jgi:hypothetical protein
VVASSTTPGAGALAEIAVKAGSTLSVSRSELLHPPL